ncbi:mucin-6 [Hyalella azteca]|uniref:Mucin-6 n=1 Tax=Hyalella azteca TaxID=294128 RepID=A0A8B7PH68_HYAAZ|nr:mucin-6 [Hyalella azteca]
MRILYRSEMFTIDSILSSKKKDESVQSSKDASLTSLGDFNEVITRIPTTSNISDSPVTTIAKPVAVRPGVIIEPSLGFLRPTSSTRDRSRASFSSAEDEVFTRPQTSPLNLHTSTTRPSPTNAASDFSTEDIDVCSSESPISVGSDRLRSPSYCTSSTVSPIGLVSQTDSMLRRPDFLAVSSRHSASIEARMYFSRHRSSTSSTTPSDPSPTSGDQMFPAPSGYGEFDDYPYSTPTYRFPLPVVTSHSQEFLRAPHFMTPRIGPSGEISSPRLMGSSLMRDLPSTSNMSMWRHLCERRPAQLCSVFDPGAAYPYPGPVPPRRRGGQVRFSGLQTRRLEEVFEVQKYITPGHRRQLAQELALHERQVKTWFQNRRAKHRKVSAHSEGGAAEGGAAGSLSAPGTSSLPPGRCHEQEMDDDDDEEEDDDQQPSTSSRK